MDDVHLLQGQGHARTVTDPLRVLEQGPDRQRAPGRCSGGLSSIRGASEFDALMIEPPMDLGNPLAAIGHRSSSPAMAVHEGGFMTMSRPPAMAVAQQRQPVAAGRGPAGRSGAAGAAFARGPCSRGGIQLKPSACGPGQTPMVFAHHWPSRHLQQQAVEGGQRGVVSRGQPDRARSIPLRHQSAVPEPCRWAPPARACPAEHLMRRAPARADSGTGLGCQ
jgi:hypothetical protein